MTAPNFLNVDLDIESKSELTALEIELGPKVIDLGPAPVSPGCFLLRLETVPEYDTPDDTIGAFCSMLEKLSPKAKRAWRAAHKKQFDVGHEVIEGHHSSQFSLSMETLKRVASLGATLGITFYHLPKTKRKSSAKSISPKRRGK